MSLPPGKGREPEAVTNKWGRPEHQFHRSENLSNHPAECPAPTELVSPLQGFLSLCPTSWGPELRS